jgi:hypothetical protein
MNQMITEWFANCAIAPGILGCGVRLPDGSCVTRSFSDGFPRERLDQVLQTLGGSWSSFIAHGLAPRWVTWTFEQGQLRAALRPDGLLLGLAIQSNSPAAEKMDLLTEEFLAMNLAD